MQWKDKISETSSHRNGQMTKDYTSWDFRMWKLTVDRVAELTGFLYEKMMGILLGQKIVAILVKCDHKVEFH